MNLYQAALTDHYRNPRNRGALANADFASTVHNPSCGDSIAWQGCITAEHITAIAFEGKGCVISQGTASMLGQAVKGKSLEECLKMDASCVLSLIGLELGPTRLRCALLPLEALQQGIGAYKQALSSILQNKETKDA